MSDNDFSPEDIIKAVAGDISSVSADNVVDIIEKANDIGKAIEMGDYLAGQRPELEDDVEDAVGGALARF